MPPSSLLQAATFTPTPKPPLCTSNPDSPLSTTANVLSILTFAFALFASYIALQSATRGAPAEIQRLVDDLRATQREINRTAEYIMGDIYSSGTFAARSNDGGAKAISATDVLYEEVQGLLRTCITLFYEADDLLKRSERDPYGFRRRLLFLMNRDEVSSKMARLESQKQKLGDIRMGLFLKKSAQHDAILAQIAASRAGVKGGWNGNGEMAGGVKSRRRASVDLSMMDGETG